MDKAKTLESIISARKFHEAQMSKIEDALEAKKVTSPPELAKTRCELGQWLYDDENHLRNILGSLFYDNIEVTHAKWHSEYSKIAEIIFNEQKKGLFSKIIGNSKIDEMEMDRAKLYYSELKVTSQELLKVMASSERRIGALADSRFH